MKAPPDNAHRAGLAWALILAACIAAAGAASLALGQDANWDLRNYHYYNPWALLNGRWAVDIAPAQVQTFHNPVGDLPFYLLAQALPARGVAFVMALPMALAAFFLAKTADLLIAQPAGAARVAYVAMAVIVGATGAAGLSLAGSTMNEWHSTAFVMAGLYLAVRGKHLGWAGFFMGCAAGLKLAYGPYAVGLAAAMLAHGTARERFRRAVRVGLFILAGWLVTGGAWAAFLYLDYGNPVFPYFNAIFRSAAWLPESFRDTRFGPRGALQWLAFPLYLSRGEAPMTEVGFRDYRMAVTWVLGVMSLAWVLLGGARRGALSTPWKVVIAFTLSSYVAWLALFGYYRYALPFEMLAGIFACGAIAHAFRRRPAIGLVVMALLATLLLGTTRRMGWERIAFGSKYFDVTMPAVAPRGLVVMAGDAPMSYALPFFPGDARFVSPANNFLRPGQPSGTARRAEAAIRQHRGPLYLMERATPPPESQAVLRHFALTRGACEPIRSNIDYDALRLCKLLDGS